MKRRTPERIASDRAAVLAAFDGKRSLAEVAAVVGRYYGDVVSDVAALCRQGHKFTYPIAPNAMRDGGGVVYRHFDAAGRLLYVGCCVNPVRRTATHASASPWFRQIVRIEVEHFASGEDAALAERNAIRCENPVHNVAFTEDEPLRRKIAASRREAAGSAA